VLSQLSISHLRNISELQFEPGSDINLLLGENGSGKTSVLEAVHLLALGRSFRTRSLKNALQFGEKHFQITAKTETQTPVGLQFDPSLGLQIRLNSAPLKRLSELASQLPLQYISANCHQFFELGPRFRRQLVDWGVFHVEPTFNFHWQSYKKILLQRNSALKKRKNSAEIRLWDEHLIQHGEKITSFRQHYLQNLMQDFSAIFIRLCSDYSSANFSLRHKSGWLKDQSFEAALDAGFERDRSLGYTRSGSHAADWSFRINDVNPAEMLSRGQQKLFYLALSMAQGSLSINKDRDKTILLIDDLSSELDLSHQKAVLSELEKLPVQSFITSADFALKSMLQREKDVVFHVERGAMIPKES
jgi:DNA replication and repair protein RecF